MPKTTTRANKPLYRTPPTRRKPGIKPELAVAEIPAATDLAHAETLASAPFILHEDGTIQPGTKPNGSNDSGPTAGPSTAPTPPKLIYQDVARQLFLYQGNCLELLDAIAAKYPEGRFDAIFADPPYFLSNGGITCHAGKMVRVDKGDWDKSRGPELNHEFNLEWLRRCQRVLKPNGTIWVSGTHHVIFSIGYALQQLGYKILNDIAWEKPNPPPNLSCRYFTHSTETVLWAAKNEKSKHLFNYQEMRKVTGKQMKTVWRRSEFTAEPENPELNPIWTLTAPNGDEKEFGKHPTQKTVALLERCLLASTNEGDLVLDPFLGGGTTAVASARLKRGCVGIELDFTHLQLAATRADRLILNIFLRTIRVRYDVIVLSPLLWRKALEDQSVNNSSFGSQIDLDLFPKRINGSGVADNKPPVAAERIYHECKFVFLSCAETESGEVVHTAVETNLEAAWDKLPGHKKTEATHVVRCETEILRVKSG